LATLLSAKQAAEAEGFHPEPLPATVHSANSSTVLPLQPTQPAVPAPRGLIRSSSSSIAITSLLVPPFAASPYCRPPYTRIVCCLSQPCLGTERSIHSSTLICQTSLRTHTRVQTRTHKGVETNKQLRCVTQSHSDTVTDTSVTCNSSLLVTPPSASETPW